MALLAVQPLRRSWTAPPSKRCYERLPVTALRPSIPRGSGGLVTLASFLVSALGLAQERPAVHLEFTRATGADSCPDGAAMRDRVSERLGRDVRGASSAPGLVGHDTVVIGDMRRDRDHWTGTVELHDETGAVRGRRSLTSRASTCDDLAETMVLTVALILDADEQAHKTVASGSSAAAPSATPAEPEQPPELDVVATPAPEQGRRARYSAGAGASASLGVEPAVAAGIDAFVARASDHFMIGLEGQIGLPAGTPSPSGTRVNGEIAVASIVPCYRAGPLLGCAVASGGVFRGSDGANDSEHPSAPYAAMGARLAALVPVSMSGVGCGLRLTLDVVAPFTRPTLAIGKENVWTAPAIGGSLGVAAYFEFL
jgi:hypothetical protein